MNQKLMLEGESELSFHFKKCLDDFCNLALGQNVFVRGYSGVFPKRFCQIPQSKLFQIYNSFHIYYQMLVSFFNNSQSGDDLRLVWWALSQFKMKGPVDLFTKLPEGSYVEFYDLNNVQIFRTFNFFKLISYTLEDLLTYEWYELYGRDWDCTDIKQEYIRKMETGDVVGITQLPIPPHRVWEKFSAERRVSVMDHLFFAPLWDSNKQPCGFLSAFLIK